MEFRVQGIEGWEKVAEKIIPKLQHHVLLLKGNLGAGKTSFTKALLKQLGSTDEVSSPTYAIVNEYDTPKGKVFHFDLYRMKNTAEVFDIGMNEYLDSAFLSIIEWPEIFEDEIDQPCHCISIEHQEDARIAKFS